MFTVLLTEATWAENSHTEFLPQALSGIFRQEGSCYCPWKNSLAVTEQLTASNPCPSFTSKTKLNFPPYSSPLRDILRMRAGSRDGGKPGPDFIRKADRGKTRTGLCSQNIKKINPRAQTLTNSTPAAWSFHPH